MTPTFRTLARLLLLAAATALLALPTAAFAGTAPPHVNWQPGGPQPLDWFERYAASHSSGVLDGRSADTLDAVLGAQQALQVPSDGRSADTLDAVQEAQQASLAPLDGRSADTLDAASAPRPVVLAQPGGFDWGDAGIGAGFAGGLGIAFAAGAALLLRRHARQRVQTT